MKIISSQDLNATWSLFARLNSSSGAISQIRTSAAGRLHLQEPAGPGAGRSNRRWIGMGHHQPGRFRRAVGSCLGSGVRYVLEFCLQEVAPARSGFPVHYRSGAAPEFGHCRGTYLADDRPILTRFPGGSESRPTAAAHKFQARHRPLDTQTAAHPSLARYRLGRNSC